ncbi:hypothetical protein [Nocardia fusca]|uniref:hypothetical protein n=1 Tax=Nocardia fusca TaxID=941183 RepID=UPI003F7658D9
MTTPDGSLVTAVEQAGEQIGVGGEQLLIEQGGDVVDVLGDHRQSSAYHIGVMCFQFRG